jgi:putative ABC transport system permease protein
MKTNLLYALRNIKNNKVNSAINFLGLSVAVACCLLIYFYISQEYSYNNFHANANRIYRINYNNVYVDERYNDVRLKPELAELLPKNIPQIEKCAEYRFSFGQVMLYRNNYYDAQIAYGSEDYFNMFSFKFIQKRNDSVFYNPYEIILTKTLADKLLGENKTYSDLLESTLEFPLDYQNIVFQIVGIIEDIPENSTMKFDAIVSGKSGNNFGGCDNGFGYATIFYQLNSGSDAKLAEQNINNYILTYYKSTIGDMQARNQLVKGKEAFVPFSTALKDNHLRGDIFTCFESSVSKRNFFILATIGFLILLIAVINCTILSLGQYLKKVGDVGVRKAMGANAANIFSIFFSESITIVALAFFSGILLSIVLIPVFGKLAQSDIYKQLINIPRVTFFCLALFLSIVVFISVIPVFIFSKVSPHQMAGNKLKIGSKSRLSQLFVSFQYSLSIILIIVTLFIVRQSNYLKSQSLGINTANVLDVDINKIDEDKKPLFAELVKENPAVSNLALTSRNFMNGSSNSYVTRDDGEQVLVFRFEVDHNYLPTLELKLLKGNNFNRENVSNGDRNMIVNQRFVEALTIQEDPIGKSFVINGISFTIIGVVADYHFEDLRHQVDPAALFTRTNWNNGFHNMLVRYQPEQFAQVQQHIKACYEKVAPGKTFSVNFWDDQLKRRYDQEERWSRIIGFASLIAIIISSLGLFGLTILLINQRVKEIGVRKVNGAKTYEILLTINRAFAVWLIGSLIIAVPVSYLIVDKWLSNYPYRVDVSWWIFIISGLLALGVALLTVSFQSLKAATRNPVEALRYE